MHFDLAAMDPEVLAQLVPAGDTAVTAIMTVFTAVFTYAIGRKRGNQELLNMQAEKKSIEATSSVTSAEAAQIISAAAAATVQPLVERVREQSEEIKILKGVISELRAENRLLRNGRE